MAYDAYGGGRPYNGPSAPRGRGGRGGPPPQAHYGTSQQQYDGYHDGYGYDQGYDQNAGYQQGYDDPYQQGGYPHGQPPPREHQDYYEPPPPRRGGRPGPGPDPRGGHHPSRGRGGMRPPDHGPGPGRGMGRRPVPGGHPGHGGRPPPPGNDTPTSPRAQGFGGDPYARRGDMDQMTDQMSNMHMNGPGGRDPAGSRASAENQGTYDDYGRPPMNGPPQGQQGYFDPRTQGQQGQGQRQGGYDGYNDGYGGRPPPQRPGHEFAPPSRSMTMPNNPTAGPERAPQRVMSYEDPGVQRGPSVDYNQNPRQPYPQQQQQQDHGYDQYGGGHENGHGYGQPQRGSYDHGYGQQYDQYDQGRGNQQPQTNHQRMESQSSLPDFDMITTNNRGSFEQTMRPGVETPQPGAHQKAQLNHAKSQPDLRQPQTAIFEMAGDIPSVPPMPPVNQPPSRQGHRNNYGGPTAYDRMPVRNPSAPPGPMNVPTPSPMGPPSVRSEPPPKNPDALPSHPTPVRAGLMSNSVVNLNDKPPPVRNYGGVPQAPTPQPQRMPQQQPQQVQQPPPQPRAVQQKPPEPPVTPQELEHLRMVIKNNPKDEESALRLAKRLIEAADVLLPNVPDPKVRGRARERYVMDAHKILKKLANAQNMGAMFTMADALGRGIFGGDSDTKEAFTLYQSAAKLGHAGAAYRTAVCCEIGHEEGGGTRKDPMKAIQWYKRAAALGDPPAMYKVGMILLKGLLGQPKNPREAVSWLKRAAERADPDNPHALHELGLLYESAKPSDTIIRDEAYAMSLFQQAADLGYKFSQFRLGQAYEYGSNGCPIDPRMSIMWYSKAAQREEHQAELALSGWYLTGSDGVLKQSDQEAYLWARKAAVAGLAKAEYAMGYFTEVGIGVPANLEDAKRWYWRAAAQEFPKARERLEDLKRGRVGGAGRPERISRSKIERQQEGECLVM